MLYRKNPRFMGCRELLFDGLRGKKSPNRYFFRILRAPRDKHLAGNT
jgi:hypothetical protein